jgi:hypothetical protein
MKQYDIILLTRPIEEPVYLVVQSRDQYNTSPIESTMTEKKEKKKKEKKRNKTKL